jgi:uncharacterized protein involved in outer membrane biogenesis
MKRWGYIILALLVLFLGAGALAFRMATQVLKGKVMAALGPGSEVAEPKVGWSSVELVDLNLEGPTGWPTARSFHAKRVKIVPSLRTLLTDKIEIVSLSVDKPYLSMVRVPGKLVMVPTLIETRQKEKDRRSNGARSTRTVAISRIAFKDGVIEVFDSTVSQPPLKIRLEAIEAVVRDVVAPSLNERTWFDLSAVVKGKRQDGRMKVSGWVAAGDRDSSSHLVLDGVDLVSLQPYLVKRGEARVDRGTLDLNLKSEVRKNRLDGKGRMVIKQLEFAPSRSYLDTFMGLPRSAVINFLQDHQDAIDVQFALTGDVSHPNFSLNETLATRVATAMAGQLGVSIRGVAEGLETLGRKGLEGASGVADAIGSAFRSLLGGSEK